MANVSDIHDSLDKIQRIAEKQQKEIREELNGDEPL